MDSVNRALDLPTDATDEDVIVGVYNEIHALSRWLASPHKEPIQHVESIMEPIASFAEGGKASHPTQETLADYTTHSLNDIVEKLDTARARTDRDDVEKQLTRCIDALETVENDVYW